MSTVILPYEEVLGAIFGRLDGTMWDSLYPASPALPRVKTGYSFICRPYASSWGAPRVEIEVS